MFDGDQGASMPEVGGDFEPKKSFFQKIFSKSETAIPVVLIVILLVILVFAFSGWDYSSTPLIGGALKSLFGGKQYNVLVIGKPAPISLNMQSDPDFKKKYNFVYRDEETMQINPENYLSSYDFIILDQSDSATQMGMTGTIPYQLAQALIQYVKSGKSLMIVGNSGHVAQGYADSYGYQALFQGIVPVTCTKSLVYSNPCEQPAPKLIILQNTQQLNIFGEITQVPEQVFIDAGTPGVNVTHYDVAVSNGNEIFTLRDVRTGKYHTGIALNKSGLGKVIYVSFPEYGQFPSIMQILFKYMA
jgi:hypothetical protein